VARLLIVDDNPEVAEALSFYFENIDIETKVITNSRDAIDIIKEGNFRPDLIILDLAMPEFSGFDVLEQISKSNDIKGMNIIVLTALVLSEEQKEQLQSRGVKEILGKPISMDEMDEIARKYFSGINFN
jgi:two-component system OmpR family response regulator